MKNDKIQISFYSLLKESRESKEIDLQTISDEIKINIKYLQAIENGNLDIVPNTYIRLFIRSYSEYLKLDSKEILKQFENETNMKSKSKNIFKNLSEKKVKEKKPEVRKISTIKNNPDDDLSHENLFFEDSINKNNTSKKFNLSERYFFKPKQIFSSISIIIILLSIYLLISYLSNQQRENISDNSEDNEGIILTDIKSDIIIDNKLLTSNNFNQNKLIKKESYKLKYNIGSPYNFQIVTKEKTKLYISYDEAGNRKEECNIIAKKDSLIKLKKTSNIYFDLWNAKHVEIAIENKSITKYLGKDDLIVRGSFKPTDKLLYLEFYNY